jgi:heavy metal sensor kinase
MTLFRSIRFRLTLWFVLLLAITLAIFSAAVYLALRENLNSNLNDSLESRAEIITNLVSRGGELDITGLNIPEDVEGEEFVRVFDASGNVVFDSSHANFQPPDNSTAVSRALAGRGSRHDFEMGPELRSLTAPVRTDGRVIGAVEVALSTEDVTSTLRVLLIIIAVAYPLTLVIATGGGVFIASRALSPIDSVTRTARRISAEDLSQRLDMRLPDDEVGRLARTFDEMIARLDEAFRRQRQFTADASHELRTPLTAIKGQTEVALQRDRDPAEYRQVLGGVNSEVDRMIRLVGSLLTLARADARQVSLAKENITLGDVVSDAVDQVRPAAESKGVSVQVRPGGDLRLTADQDLLLQLMLNLLDNAVKHTPPGKAIEVSWSSEPGYAKVVVSDEGAGIDAEHLPHIFDRFFRVDKARSREAGGVGLGLSISRWIVEAHGGSIRAESAPGKGARFTVSIPIG